MIRHIITPAMVRAIDRHIAAHPGKVFAETADLAAWRRIEQIEHVFRYGRDCVRPASDVLEGAFTHEVRALILTATARLEQDRQAPAKQGCHWLSPIPRLCSMYAEQRKAAPDAPVAEILRRVVAATDA